MSVNGPCNFMSYLFKIVLKTTVLQITGQSCPLSFKGSPYWMAPEVSAFFYFSDQNPYSLVFTSITMLIFCCLLRL